MKVISETRRTCALNLTSTFLLQYGVLYRLFYTIYVLLNMGQNNLLKKMSMMCLSNDKNATLRVLQFYVLLKMGHIHLLKKFSMIDLPK